MKFIFYLCFAPQETEVERSYIRGTLGSRVRVQSWTKGSRPLLETVQYIGPALGIQGQKSWCLGLHTGIMLLTLRFLVFPVKSLLASTDLRHPQRLHEAVS